MLSGLSVWLTVNIAQIAISAWAYTAQRQAQPAHWNIAQQWVQWDGIHYVRIAIKGYKLGPDEPAFFPLYPMLIRAGDRILPGSTAAIAWTIAHLCALGAFILLYRLAEHEFGTQVARRAIIYLSAFPMAFFLLAPFSTSLFLMLSIGTLYAVRRGHWWLAGVLSALSSATRLFGILLIIPMVIEYIRQRNSGERRVGIQVLSIAAVPLGLLGYMIYCARALGNPMAFSAAQDQWGRHYVYPGMAWLDAFAHTMQQPRLQQNTLAAMLDTGIFLGAAILMLLSLVGPWRMRRDQFYLVAYSAATMILLTMTEVGGDRPMQSAPRYTMEATAIFLVLARIGANSFVDRFVVITGVALQTVLTIIFLSFTMFIA